MSTVAGDYSITASRFRIVLSIAGGNFGVWDKLTGGGLKSNSTKYSPGGAGTQIVLAGNQTVDDLVLSRSYNLARDHAVMPTFYALNGIGSAVIKAWPLDNNKNIFGNALSWTGLLSEVQAPEPDSTSNEPAMLTLTFLTNGNPSGGGTS